MSSSRAARETGSERAHRKRTAAVRDTARNASVRTLVPLRATARG